jgi:hypothetical protein
MTHAPAKSIIVVKVTNPVVLSMTLIDDVECVDDRVRK